MLEGAPKMKMFVLSALAVGLVLTFYAPAPALAGAGKEAFVGCQITGCPEETKAAEMRREKRRMRREARRHM